MKSGKMSRVVFVFMILLNATLCSMNKKPECPSQILDCECSNSIDFWWKCPKKIQVQVKADNSVNLTCLFEEEASLSPEEIGNLIPNMTLGEIPVLRVINCEVRPSTSINSYLKNIDYVKIEKLIIWNIVNHSGTLLGVANLRGLDSLKTFEFNGKRSDIVLPLDFFRNMTALRECALRNASLTEIPERFFVFLHNLSTLDLSDNQLKSMSKASFEGLEGLKILHLRASGIEFLEHDVFFHLTNLSEIILSANNFASLPDGLFKYNKKLVKFQLLQKSTTVKTLPRYLLANMTELMEVRIKCGLLELPKDIFQGSNNIMNIRLNGNSLTELDDDIFWDLKLLKTLNLSGNSLTEISK